MFIVIVLIVMLLGIIIYSCRSGEVSSHPAEDGRRPETCSRPRVQGESRPQHGNIVDEAQSDCELRRVPRHQRRPEVQAHRHRHPEDRELGPRHRRLGFVRRRVVGGCSQSSTQPTGELGAACTRHLRALSGCWRRGAPCGRWRQVRTPKHCIIAR